MSENKPKTTVIQQKEELSKVRSKKGELLSNILKLSNDKLRRPFDFSITGNVIGIDSSEIRMLQNDGSGGTKNANRAALPFSTNHEVTGVASLDVSTGVATGSFNTATPSTVTVVANEYVWLGFERRRDGQIYLKWGIPNASPTQENYPVFTNGAHKIIMILLQDDGSGSSGLTWNFVAPLIENVIALSESGSGSGTTAGDADTLHLIRVDDISLGDITVTGKNATPDGGGTLTPSSLTISDVAAELLRGDTVIKYLPSANGQGDYAGFERAIPLGDRQSNIGFQLMLKNTATTLDNDFVFWVKQMNGTMSGKVAEFNLPAQYSDGTGKTIRTDSFVAHDCTLIRFGIQNKSATTTVGINIDNILVTANPFVRTQMLDHQYVAWRSITPITWESNYADIPSTPTENKGANIVQWTSTTTGVEFTVNRECLLTIKFQVRSTGSAYPIQRTYVRRNGFDVGTVGAITVHGPDTVVGEYPAIFKGIAVPGEVYKLYTTGTLSDYLTVEVNAQAEKEGIVHVTGDLGDKLTETKLLTSNFGTNNAVITDLTFTNLKIGRWYRISGNTAFGGEYLNVNRLQVTYKNGTTIVGKTFYYNYQAGGTSGYEGYNVHALFKATDTTLTFNTESQISNCFLVGTNSKEYTYITLEEDSILNPMTIITPVTETAYLKDVKANNTNGGTFTSGAWQTRDLNTVEGDTSFVSLLNDQFKIGAGVYEIEPSAPGFKVTRHKIKLYNLTTTDEVIGTSELASGSDNTQTRSSLKTKITLTETCTFEIRHRCEDSASVNGLGVASNFGVGEVYTTVKITRLKSN